MAGLNEMTFDFGGKKIELSKADFNNAKKSFFDPSTVEGKEIQMAMTVDASAEYTTNAQEYYREALIGDTKTRAKFRQLLGVKDRVNLGTADLSAIVVKAGTCAYDPGSSVLKQKEYEVKALMLGTDFCINSLEVAFMSDQLARGSNNFNQQFAFMNWFFAYLGEWVSDQVDAITFKGVLATNGVDGLEVLMAADVNVLKPLVGDPAGVASAVTSANIIAKLKQARSKMTTAVRMQKDFVYIVSQNVYDALADIVSEEKASGLYYIENVTLTFQGVPVYLAAHASDNVIIATYWSNLVNVMDLMDEELGFNIVDFMKTALIRKIGVRVDFKFQPTYVNSEEIYFHKP